MSIFIRPTFRDVLWYGAGVCLSVRLSVRLSTKLVDTIQTEPFKLGPSNLVHLLLMTRGGQLLILRSGSKVKVTYWTLLLSLVNKVQPFYNANPLKFSRRAYFATLALLLLAISRRSGTQRKLNPHKKFPIYSILFCNHRWFLSFQVVKSFQIAMNSSKWDSN